MVVRRRDVFEDEDVDPNDLRLDDEDDVQPAAHVEIAPAIGAPKVREEKRRLRWHRTLHRRACRFRRHGG